MPEGSVGSRDKAAQAGKLVACLVLTGETVTPFSLKPLKCWVRLVREDASRKTFL